MKPEVRSGCGKRAGSLYNDNGLLGRDGNGIEKKKRMKKRKRRKEKKKKRKKRKKERKEKKTTKRKKRIKEKKRKSCNCNHR